MPKTYDSPDILCCRIQSVKIVVVLELVTQADMLLISSSFYIAVLKFFCYDCIKIKAIIPKVISM